MPNEFERGQTEWTLSEEWIAQKAEGERRKWAYENPHHYEAPKVDHATPALMPTREGRGHAMDETPPLIYLEGPADLAALKRELADLDRDIELMARHETVRYEESE